MMYFHPFKLSHNLRNSEQVTAGKPQNLSRVSEGSTHHHCLEAKLLVVVVDLGDTEYTCTHKGRHLTVTPAIHFPGMVLSRKDFSMKTGWGSWELPKAVWVRGEAL